MNAARFHNIDSVDTAGLATNENLDLILINGMHFLEPSSAVSHSTK